jgi:hypothetical protein
MPKTKHDRPSYEGSASWTKFKALMENRFGHVIELEPEESWFEWRGHQIHLDSLSPNGTLKGTLVLVHGAGGHGRLLTPLGAVAADKSSVDGVLISADGVFMQYKLSQNRISWGPVRQVVDNPS